MSMNTLSCPILKCYSQKIFLKNNLIRCDNHGENVAVGGTATGSPVVEGKKWERAIDQIADQNTNGGT
jgi:hypothetical protein